LNQQASGQFGFIAESFFPNLEIALSIHLDAAHPIWSALKNSVVV